MITLAADESRVEVNGAELFVRQIGEGGPTIILHGGPDFDHTYLVPGLDILADCCRLIYFDQRGRGRSTGDEIGMSVRSEIEDIDALRSHLGHDRVAVIGHSWGGVLAMEYAMRFPDRVSHLIVLNTAPAHHDDWVATRDRRNANLEDQLAELQEIRDSVEFKAGDPPTVSRYYMTVFRRSVARPEDAEHLNFRLEHFNCHDILRSRRIENVLYGETAFNPAYDITPRLHDIIAPTLIIHGDLDFVPPSAAERIASAIPHARLLILPECGHFAYVEKPDDVHRAIRACLSGQRD